MNASTYLQSKSKRKPFGLAAVVVLHVLLLLAIQSGLNQTHVHQLPKVVQAFLLAEKPPEPAPPKPTPIKPIPPKPIPPKSQAPQSPLPPPEATPSLPAAASLLTAPAPKAIAVSPAPAAVAPPALAPTAPAAVVPAAPPALAARPKPPVRTAAGVNMAQCDKPVYPSASKRMEEEGTVGLRFLLGTDGKVLQSEVEKSSGYKRLDEAARVGLAKCLFKPAMVDGQAEPSWTTIRYVWVLE